MDEPTIYQIVVQGELSENWREWFRALAVYMAHHTQGTTTTLAGPVTDQAALRGILSRLWDLNLVLLSVQRLTHPETSPVLRGTMSEKPGRSKRR